MPENNPASLRVARLETSRLAWAFVLSIAVHLLLWGGYHGGKKLHLWEKLRVPAWVEKVEKTLIRTAKSPAKPLPKESEPPLMYVDVSPDQVTTEPPKDAKFYSSANSQAANLQADRITDVPKITGEQKDVPKTEDADRQKFAKLQPALPAEQPQSEQLASPKLQPTPPVEPPQPQPLATPQPKIELGDLTVAKPEEKPTTDQGIAPRPRPRRLSELAQNKIVRPPGRKMKQDGGVRRLALTALDAKGTEFGTYDALFINAVSDRWYALLEDRQYASDARGRVALQFKLHHDGRITEMNVVENTVSETLSLICQKAVLDPAPFEKWSSEMRLRMNENFRRIQFTFYYQ